MIANSRHDRKHRVLVTGASGTLGCNVVRLLASNPNTQVVLPLRTLQPALFRDYANVHMRKADLAEPSHLAAILSDVEPTALVHCAASGVRPRRHDTWFDMLTFNVETTLRIFEATTQVEDLHFIYISTGLVYRHQGRPIREDDPVETIHPYGVSKLAADQLLQATAAEFQRDLTVLRPFSFTGLQDGGTRLFPVLLNAALTGKPLDLSPGKQVRDYCAVQDIAAAVQLILDRQREHRIEVFNLGSGLSMTLGELLEKVCRDLDLNVQVNFGAIPYYTHEPMHLVADITRARAAGWAPTTSLSYAVWQLAQAQFPNLPLRRPEPLV